ncbi:MAG: radical SAM protein [Coriobacteriales bacterium]
MEANEPGEGAASGLPGRNGNRKTGGLAGCEREGAPLLPPGLANYIDRGLTIANDGKSYIVNWQSSACANCRLGLNAKTFILSTRCPRHCFFCFNPNQVDYDRQLERVHDAAAELESDYKQGARYTHLALTGGEPLLHPCETVGFFQKASELYPHAHTRLYTSGAFLDEPLMGRMRDAHLQEIRFSIKTEEGRREMQRTLETIAKAKNYFDDVMVEMPVVPGELELMKWLLLQLEDIGIAGINLLELGYPLANAAAFAKRGLKIKEEPMRVLYNYDYAGGLPIAGSEEECLQLLEYALDKRFHIGIHYCSMENKYSGQIYQQNAPHVKEYPQCVMSDKDFFLKSAKVFGADSQRAQKVFRSKAIDAQSYRADDNLTEFSPVHIPLLAGEYPSMEIALGYNVVERRDGEWVLRELRVDRTSPAAFDIRNDI